MGYMPRISDIQIRDPYVLARDGVLWLYGSTDKDIWRADGVGFDCYRSDGNLTYWEGPFPCFRPPRDFWSKRNFWAPEVHEYNGAFYMFATFLPVSGSRGTAVLRSDKPEGPFLPYSDGPVTPRDWECLDGTLYIAEGKTPYIIFCHEWTQIGDGQICARRLKDDLSGAVGDAFTLFSASEAKWSHPLKDRANGSYVTDGPFVWRAPDGNEFLLWSSFDADGSYCLGQTRMEFPGVFIQSETPLISGDGGHGMIFEHNGKLYLTVHSPNRTPDERAQFTEITYCGGQIKVKDELK